MIFEEPTSPNFDNTSESDSLVAENGRLPT
jgi:hypothetical protein